ncbi:MAG: hypothetical protein ACREXS_11130 [Gammaproteobacteria bacterium]
MQKLDDATDVVALLTIHSVNRPWILYEAGVAKGKLAASDRVFGIALGVSLAHPSASASGSAGRGGSAPGSGIPSNSCCAAQGPKEGAISSSSPR